VGKIAVTFSESSAVWMKQMPPAFGKQLDADTLVHVLGLDLSDIDSRFPVEEVSTGFPHLIVPLKNLDALKRAKINREEYFALVTDAWAKNVWCTAAKATKPHTA
jgi:trans-2,3-dihydro-3-hydroxyanthranilate isomerase